MSDSSVELAFRQAGSTVSTYLAEAIEAIDRHFGEGYAQKHPELVGAFIMACTNDVQAMLLFESLNLIANTI
jgi:hypothetical protein